MTQTVAIKRGSGSFNGNYPNGNRYLLWTQSGGNGTRVIPISFVLRRTDSDVTNSSQTCMSIQLDISGGTTDIISAIDAGTNWSYIKQAFSWPRYTGATPPGTGNINYTAANNWPFYRNNNSSTSTTFANKLSETYMILDNNFNKSPIQQFWMGDGDSVYFAFFGYRPVGKSTSNISGTYYYSFMTITES